MPREKGATDLVTVTRMFQLCWTEIGTIDTKLLSPIDPIGKWSDSECGVGEGSMMGSKLS